MQQTQSGLLIKMAPVVFSLVLGGVGGYFLHTSVGASTLSPTAASGGKSSPGGMGGMGGGQMGGGGRGGGQPSSGATLSRTVRGLAVLQKVQNKGLTTDQAKRLLPIAQEIQTAEKLPEKDAAAKLAAVQAVLTEDQKLAIDELQPARGGRGAGGGKGGGSKGGGAPGGGGMPGGQGGGGYSGGGGQQDPEKPFASERNKQGLEDLIASLKQPEKH